MSLQHQKNALLTRRRFVKTAAGLSLIPFTASLLGCGSSSASSSNVDTEDSQSAGDDSALGGSTTFEGWAQGGTSAMVDDFPDDTLFETSSTCNVTLTGAQTEGPCYFQSDYLDDISYGKTGLPMMLCLQLIDENCNPLAGYEIEVWHCDVEGVYSGDTSDSADSSRFSSGFCTGGDEEALNATWFRGVAVTDASGRVNIKSCFPGWYSSRAIHIHFRIRRNNYDQLVSQFGFSDSFCQTICGNHADYQHRGEPDTLLGRDTVFGSDYNNYLFDIAQNSDGSLLAYKRIIIGQ